MDASSDLHAIVDKGEEKNRIRKIERGLKVLKLSSRQRADVDGVLKLAAKILQPKPCADLERALEKAVHMELEFFPASETAGCHWKARRRHVEPRAHSVDEGVGPRFDRTRVIVLCRHQEDGHLFLVCSCYRYQRELKPCACILALKRHSVHLFEDVSFVWHLAYASLEPTRNSCFKLSADMGKIDGPGVRGVPVAELKIAIEDMPQSRNGVIAWLREGGASWVPLSRVIWRGVSESSWRQELMRARMDAGLHNTFVVLSLECTLIVFRRGCFTATRGRSWTRS